MTTPARDWEPGPSLGRHLRALVGDRSPLGTPEALRAAQDYAERVFNEASLATSREPIAASKGAWHNVIADRAGAGGSPLFIIGAHLDTVEGTPGADDNASGVAALLALAEWAGGRPAPSAITLRFAAFNLEEWGMVGSQEHADALHAADARVRGMISLEMIAYVDPSPRSQRYPPGVGIGRRKSGDFISVVGDLASRRLVKAVGSALGEGGGLPVETLALPASAALLVGATLSDHSSFWRRGYPAVMVGDTAFYRNPHYHQPTDTLETLSMPFLSKVTLGIARFLETIGV
jgi:Zn-dependent M28 family amino/carboxypeptidase